MGFFQMIVVGLIGTKKKYEVKNLDTLETKVCSWWPDRCYTWSNMVKLPFQPEQTVILVHGNAAGPYPQQLSLLRALLQNWEAVIKRLDSLLPIESRLAHKEEIYAAWKDTFYLESITPTWGDDGWEITFERRDDLKDYISFTWINNSVQELTLNVGYA